MCPRCNQWRTPSQIDVALGVCGACADRVAAPDLNEPRLRDADMHSAPTHQQRSAAPRAVAVDEVAWLAGWDTEESIARRVGCPSAEALRRRLYRAGRPDLVAALTATRRVVGAS